MAKLICVGKDGFFVYMTNSKAEGCKITRCHVCIEKSSLPMSSLGEDTTKEKCTTEKQSLYKAHAADC